ALRVHLRAPSAPERGRLPAHGCACWRGGGLPVPDQQPCAAPLVRLQAGQRWARHPIDPTLSWPQVDRFDGSLHGARAGSVQGFLERLRKTHQRMRTARPLPATAKEPRGDPRIIWVPYSRLRPSFRRFAVNRDRERAVAVSAVGRTSSAGSISATARPAVLLE